MTKHIETFWGFSVHFGETSYRSSTSGHGGTIEAALQRGFETATYYLGMGYMVKLSLHEYCTACGGVGSIATGRFTRKVCRACKGHDGELRTIATPVNAHENIRIVDNPDMETA